MLCFCNINCCKIFSSNKVIWQFDIMRKKIFDSKPLITIRIIVASNYIKK